MSCTTYGNISSENFVYISTHTPTFSSDDATNSRCSHDDVVSTTSQTGKVHCSYLDATDGRQQLKQLIVNTSTANQTTQQPTYPRVIAATVWTPDSCYVHLRNEFLHRRQIIVYISHLHLTTLTLFKREFSTQSQKHKVYDNYLWLTVTFLANRVSRFPVSFFSTRSVRKPFGE